LSEPPEVEPRTSRELLIRIRAGEVEALDSFCGRYRAGLLRWAHGRLPARARERYETEDLVQETLIGAVNRLSTLEYRGPGGVAGYLRTALANRVRDEVRRARRRPAAQELDERHADDTPSPLATAIGNQTLERYDRALEALDPEMRELILARVELGLSYKEIAVEFARPSADAARMAVGRALVRLAEEMARLG
jgi:RNA polymerase sigma-70 factor (ECF subfamily)